MDYPVKINYEAGSVTVNNEKEMLEKYDTLMSTNYFKENVKEIFVGSYPFYNYMGVMMEIGEQGQNVWIDQDKMERLEFMRSMQAETWRRTMKRKILAVSLVACLCLMTSCAQIHDTVTEESQAQSAQTMQTEAADTETTEALDSTEESDTEYIDTTYTPEKIRKFYLESGKSANFLVLQKFRMITRFIRMGMTS